MTGDDADDSSPTDVASVRFVALYTGNVLMGSSVFTGGKHFARPSTLEQVRVLSPLDAAYSDIASPPWAA